MQEGLVVDRHEVQLFNFRDCQRSQADSVLGTDELAPTTGARRDDELGHFALEVTDPGQQTFQMDDFDAAPLLHSLGCTAVDFDWVHGQLVCPDFVQVIFQVVQLVTGNELGDCVRLRLLGGVGWGG